MIQSLKMALKSLAGNRMRAFLTMLGIIIGVVALVVLVSLVSAATGTVTALVSDLGSDMLEVYIYDDKGDPVTLETLEEWGEDENIGEISPCVSTMGTAKFGTTSDSITIYGTTPGYYSVSDLSLSLGRFLKSTDVDNSNYVCVISESTAEDIIGYLDCLGEEISIDGMKFTIVGVLEEDSDSLMSMLSFGVDSVYIPYTTLIRMSSTVSTDIEEFYVSAAPGGTNADAETAITDILMERFDDDDEAFYVYNQDAIEDSLSTITAVLTGVLGGIAAISLLVGGIGIMNIMLVTVTERTREIGIRKAIGATRGKILRQFLMEAIVLCMIGCAIGIFLSWVILQLAGVIASSLGMVFTMNRVVVIVAIAFSFLIGLIFGLYPSNKAAKMKPIDALHYNGEIMKKFRKVMDKITSLPVLKRRWLYILGIVIFTILFLAMMLLSVAMSFLPRMESSPQMQTVMSAEYEEAELTDGETAPEGFPDAARMSGREDGEDLEYSEDDGEFYEFNGEDVRNDNRDVRALRVLAIVFAALDALCIYMLVYLRRKRSRTEQEEMRERWEQTAADGEPHVIRSDDQKQKHPYRIWIILIIIVVALIVLVEILTHRDRGGESQTEATLYSGEAEISDLTTVLPGSGTLTEDDAEDVSLPEGVRIKRWYVSNGDSVEEGDLLAMVDKVSAMTTIVEVQDKLDSLDTALAECEDQTASDTITAPASGRVIKIYATQNASVVDVMYRDSALMLLSLDGQMAVSIDTDADLTAGDEVTVTLSDGTEMEGRVDSMTNQTAVITVSDDGPTLGDDVTVTTAGGVEVGEGELYIHSEWKVTGFVGTVASIPVSEGETVSSGETLLTLNETDDTGAYEILLEQRAKLESQMESLFQVYTDGYLYAPCAGVISGLDTSTATEKSTGTEKNTSIEESNSMENSTTVGEVNFTIENVSYAAEAPAAASHLVTSGSTAYSAADPGSAIYLSADVGSGEIAQLSAVDDYKSYVSELKKQVEELEKLLKDFQDLADADPDNPYLAELVQNLKAIDEAISEIEKNLEGLEDSIVDIDTDNTDLEELEKQLEELKQENDDLRNQLESSDTGALADLESLEQRIRELEEENARLTAELESGNPGGDNTGVNLEDLANGAGGLEVGGNSDFDFSGYDLSGYDDLADLYGDYGDLDDIYGDISDLGDLSDLYGDIDMSELEDLEGAGLMDEAFEEDVEETYGIEDQTLLSLIPQDTMTVTITVDEMDILRLEKGQTARVTLDAFPGQSFEGTVTAIHRSGTNSGGNTKYTADIVIDREEGMLAGMNASAQITIDTVEDVLCIPEAALDEENGITYVYTTYNDGTDELGGKVEVTTGVSDGTTVQILSGLEEGDEYFYKYLDVVNYESASSASEGGFF